MAEIIETPLSRMKKKHDAALAEKDKEIAELKRNAERVRGVRDLLVLELNHMEKSLHELLEHVMTLRRGLNE